MATFDGKHRHGDDLRDRVSTLWGAGLSASQIAAEIGGLSRSAVCGIASRMGLSRGRAAGSRPKQPRASGKTGAPSRTAVKIVQREAPPVQPIEPLPLEQHDPVRPCLWPYGDGGDAGICGRARDANDWRARYCRAHRAAAIRPQKGGAIKLCYRSPPRLDQLQIARPFRFREAAPQ